MHIHTLLALTIILSGVSIAACDRRAEPTPAARTSTPAKTPTTGTDADNTGRNKVDRDASTKSPMDQSNSGVNIKITAEIRRAIMEDKSMSVNAQNCKIITDNAGIVTLRGPVASKAEKDAIEAAAKAVAGVNSVINELEVKQN